MLLGDFMFDLFTLRERSLGHVGVPRRLELVDLAGPSHTVLQSLPWPPSNYLPQTLFGKIYESVRASIDGNTVTLPAKRVL